MEWEYIPASHDGCAMYRSGTDVAILSGDGRWVISIDKGLPKGVSLEKAMAIAEAIVAILQGEKKTP